MDILNYTFGELFGLNKSLKLQAIKMLIDSIADDAAFEVKASMETDREYAELKDMKFRKIRGS